ncbi:MAG: RNA methyltransferase [Sphingobacteriales bacterium]|nr:MAG: RNA methyltransferase [Sphingobacteriales bacterium]
MIKQITSLSNPLIKQVLSLETARERDKTGLFAVEGLREINLAQQANYFIQTLIYCPEYTGHEHLRQILSQSKNLEFVEVTKDVFEKIAYRKYVPNAIALCHSRPLLLQNLTLSANPLMVVVEAVEKPGNLGAILRTADAAGVDALVLCHPQTDVFNPNVIRSSLGAVFTCPVAVCTTDEAISFFRTNSLPIIAAAITPSAKPYHEQRLDMPCAIAFGSEAEGLSKEWLETSDHHAIIPMYGHVNSLNVSVSAAVFIYEAIRQRVEMKKISSRLLSFGH